MRRLGIFLFYDRDGKISDHIVHLLAKFSEHIERIVVIANGPLVDGQKKRIEPYVSEIHVRDNFGFDVGGYIHGLEVVGYDNLADYDEVVLFNYTVFGPVFDLAEMFDEMERRDIDFWGQTQYVDKTKAFLQSYFLVTRRRLHASPTFREYWSTLPEIKSIDDSIHFHEFRFTDYFVDRGFKESVYIENELKWRGNTTLVDLPGLLAKRTPLIKYRAFNFNALEMERRGGLTGAANFRLLDDETSYPVDLIWDYILSQGTSDQIIDSITGTTVTVGAGDWQPDLPKVDVPGPVIFLSVEDEASFDDIADRLTPVTNRVYLVSTKEALLARARALGWSAMSSERTMTGFPIAAFRERITEIVASDDIVYNLSCMTDDRNDYYFRQAAIEEYWGPLLLSPVAVKNIAHRFRANPRVGLLFAPTNSFNGRIRRMESLCPRASNWTFADYPADVRFASSQTRWPWRGNAAIAGRLALATGYIDRLSELHQQMKPVKAQKPCGVEGFMAELARQAGFASGLVVSLEQAEKLATRYSRDEPEMRRLAAKQAQKFNHEIAELRAVPEAPVKVKAPAEVVTSKKEPKQEPKKAAKPKGLKHKVVRFGKSLMLKWK
ncbi:hypothetical protein KX729_17195 [Rhizobium sp. XQZ8]|uniref:rhamnan synthesis F family protein n=1 Tax=Rhizobium populisoli TaxID=2859785 RepID=UPI001CA51482|nr:rhamnan synthesis F family protein [Rhizobium populisoli]MBW6423196.1 hypothetical protein [Rhizobium populisoli]